MEYKIKNWSEVKNYDYINCLTSSKKDSEELAEMNRLLHFNLGLQLPLRLRKRERPDFELSETENTRQIGIEHTWAAHEGWEESEQVLLSTKRPKFEYMSRNWLEGVKAKGRKLGKIITAQEGVSAIWSAREQANSKARELRLAIEKKRTILSKDGFETYPENWLFVSDRCPFLFLDLDIFRKELDNDPVLSESGYSRILFITKIRCRKRGMYKDVLFELSNKRFLLVEDNTHQSDRASC
jgi:hypothetical protein